METGQRVRQTVHSGSCHLTINRIERIPRFSVFWPLLAGKKLSYICFSLASCVINNLKCCCSLGAIYFLSKERYSYFRGGNIYKGRKVSKKGLEMFMKREGIVLHVIIASRQFSKENICLFEMNILK